MLIKDKRQAISDYYTESNLKYAEKYLDETSAGCLLEGFDT
jgi:hypothetical protein